MSRMLSKDAWRDIETFEHVENENEYFLDDRWRGMEWEKVYCEGCDSKYGSLMVCWEKRLVRNPTAEEFYGNAPWD